jgi:hypothetical protein
MRVLRHILPLLVLGAVAGGCRRVRFEDQVLTRPDVRYQVGELPSDWRRVRLSDNDLAFFLDDTGQALAVNATCRGHDDPPLEVLTRHLMMGFTERERVSQERVMLDGREALRSRYRAKMDGVPVELMLVVLKKDNCVYDFSYVAPPERFEERLGDFEVWVGGFHAERTS